ATALTLFELPLQLPAFDLLLLSTLLRWGTLALVIAGLIWVMSIIFPQTPAGNGKPTTTASSE
ncbi:MAG: hypothetical protein VX471_03290, partial [Acidobacteriota bacterium]|nr:hypothetical protein [Acidobacteriota bacterium]